MQQIFDKKAFLGAKQETDETKITTKQKNNSLGEVLKLNYLEKEMSNSESR